VLVVTTTVRMLHGVLSDTSDLRPAIPLDGVLVVGPSRLEKGFVSPASACHDADLGPDGGRNSLLPAAGEAQAGGAFVLVVHYNDGESTGTASKGPSISLLGLDVANDGTFGNGAEGQDVTDRQSRLLAAVHELSRVHSLRADQQLVVFLVIVGIAELDLRYGSTTARIVEDFLHDAPNVSVLLGIVESAEFHGTFPRSDVGLEDGRLSLSLGLLCIQWQHCKGNKSERIELFTSDFSAYRSIRQTASFAAIGDNLQQHRSNHHHPPCITRPFSLAFFLPP